MRPAWVAATAPHTVPLAATRVRARQEPVPVTRGAGVTLRLPLEVMHAAERALFAAGAPQDWAAFRAAMARPQQPGAPW